MQNKWNSLWNYLSLRNKRYCNQALVMMLEIDTDSEQNLFDLGHFSLCLESEDTVRKKVIGNIFVMDRWLWTSAGTRFPIGSWIKYSRVTGTRWWIVTGWIVGFQSVNVNYKANKDSLSCFIWKLTHLSKWDYNHFRIDYLHGLKTKILRTWFCPSMGRHSLMFEYGQRKW